MDIKTNLPEEYINFVDNTRKQNKNFKIIIILFVIILCLFLFFVFFIIIQNNIRTFIRLQV